MKNFLSQTWVVAVIALITLAAILLLSYKLSNKKTEKETENQTPSKENKPEETSAFRGRK